MESLTLQLGNLCNLKCRICGPHASFGIAADPVHNAWAKTEGSRATNSLDLDSVYTLISMQPDKLRHIQLSGGEPLTMPATLDFLQRLITEARMALDGLHEETEFLQRITAVHSEGSGKRD